MFTEFVCKKCCKKHYGKSLEGMCLKCYSLKIRAVEVLPIEEFRHRAFQPPRGNEEGGYSTYDL